MQSCTVCGVPDGLWRQRRLGATEWRAAPEAVLGRDGWSISVPSLIWANTRAKWPPLCQSCLRTRMALEKKR